MSYCIYLRKSRADAEAELTGEGETLTRHENALLALAKKQKLSVTKIYKEILSGETIAARPAMQELLDDVASGIWKGVLVMEVERLGRGNTLDQGIILNTFQYSGTKIITPLKTYDPNNEFDEEYFEFSQFMSRREYKTILRRMQRGRETSAKEGKFVGSVAPYGYRRIKLENEKGYSLAIEPEEANFVALAFSLYAYGDPQADGTTADIGRTAIAKRFTQMGAKPRRGSVWATSSITAILQNPVYIGKIHWNRHPHKKTAQNGQIKITRPLADAFLLADGLHEPIISEMLWNTVQEKMRRHSRPTGTSEEIQNPLAGIVRCSYCGAVMQRRPYSKTGQPATLICTTHFCPQISTALPLVEKRILDGLSEWLRQYAFSYEIENPSTDIFSEKIRTLKVLLASLQKELVVLEKQQQNAFDFLEKGIYSPEIFKERTEILEKKRSACKESICNEEKALSALENAENKQSAPLPEIHTLSELYECLSPAEQNRLLKELLDHVEYQKSVNGRWHHSPDDFSLTLYPRLSKDR